MSPGSLLGTWIEKNSYVSRTTVRPRSVDRVKVNKINRLKNATPALLGVRTYVRTVLCTSPFTLGRPIPRTFLKIANFFDRVTLKHV